MSYQRKQYEKRVWANKLNNQCKGYWVGGYYLDPDKQRIIRLRGMKIKYEMTRQVKARLKWFGDSIPKGNYWKKLQRDCKYDYL